MATAAAAAASSAITSHAGKKMITRWSLNALARIGKELKQHHTPACLEISRDIALRLGEQQAHIDQLESFLDQSLHDSHHYGKQQQEEKAHSSGGPKIIKTSNFSHPNWWNLPQADQKLQQQNQKKSSRADEERHKRQKVAALEKARRNLRNLKILHENTYDMADQLWHHLQGKGSSDSTLNKKEQKWLKAALKQVRDRHAMTVENLAEFVIETRPYLQHTKNNEKENEHQTSEAESALDATVMNFLRGRFGVQILCEHAVGGIICEDCRLQDVLEDAIAEARILCESHYSHLVTAAPEVVIANQTQDRKDQFTIVRPWVHYVLVELLKNAMSASMERFSQQQERMGDADHDNDDNDDNDNALLPPNIYIALDEHHGDNDDNSSFFSIDLFDQGGGFPSNKIVDDNVLFGFVKNKTTMWDRLDDQQTYAMTRSPMQGLGVGLCLSRLMMSHFGGTVELREHPPLLHRQQHQLKHLSEDLDAGCVASVKLQKDLDYPEQLYEEEDSN